MLSIVQAPNEILRSPAKPVNLPVVKLRKIIDDMTKTLVAQVDPEGVGLAANQVNLPYQLFLARFDTKRNSPVHVFINPEIISHSNEVQPANKAEEEKAQLEGCLSLPKYYGIVKRYKWVKVKYQKLSDGQKTQKNRNSDNQTARNSDSPSSSDFSEITETFSGFAATVIQHEMDHLNGRIFVERILEQNGKLYKTVGKDKKGKDIWDEVKI